MTDAERIVGEILADIDRRTADEHAVFSQQVFSDQPILQTGRQLRERQERSRRRAEARERGREEEQRRRQDALRRRQLSRQATHQGVMPAGRRTPQRYRQMEALGRGGPGSVGYLSPTSSRLFFEQARLMEDFEDDYESGYLGPVALYYPTYAAMTLDQQRSYFSWRTRLRHGGPPDAPASFAFVHAFELLCGIGTTPGEQGLRDLVDFARAYGATDAARGTTFASRLRLWARDYAVYHGLDLALVEDGSAARGDAVACLLDAEDALLARAGRARAAKTGPRGAEPPDRGALFDALCAVSSYHLDASRLARDLPDDLRTVTCDVFAALVDHCSRRRKTDFVEGLFGRPSELRYTMYAQAVFYDPQPHADVIVRVSRNEAFVCQGGRWTRHLTCRREGTSRELGETLRAIDRRMRERLGHPHPLKARTEPPRYLAKIIDAAIDAQLERRRAEEARRIEIDLSKLRDIRAAAAVTREALLVDEEREELPEPAGGTGERAPGATGEPDGPAAPAPTPPCPADAGAGRPLPPGQGAPPPSAWGLTGAERRVLAALLDGEDPAGVLAAGDPMLSLVADSINEKLLDAVGDAVIEFDGEAPTLVADYRDDVREALARE